MAQQQTWQFPSRIAVSAEETENNLYFACKRGMDVILACLLLILLSPLLLLIAILIKLDSPGPVIFSQERVGSQRQWLGRTSLWVIRNFRMLKFRSMYQNADPAVHEAYIRDFVEGRARPSEQSDGKFKLTNDPRVTRVGRILRKFSLDELLQLVNVLKGDMSLVGPRPHPVDEVNHYELHHYRRLDVKPGITGLWQITARNCPSFELNMHLDLTYIENWSLRLDLGILARTVRVLFAPEGA